MMSSTASAKAVKGPGSQDQAKDKEQDSKSNATRAAPMDIELRSVPPVGPAGRTGNRDTKPRTARVRARARMTVARTVVSEIKVKAKERRAASTGSGAKARVRTAKGRALAFGTCRR